MKKKLQLLIFAFVVSLLINANPVINLVERIGKGASEKFIFELVDTTNENDFFELDQLKDKVVIRGNNYVSIATGLNWYLKYYANIHLSWNSMQADLSGQLPPVIKRERREASEAIRYYLNYCTFSYSMAFWDWNRWEQEIDWMALHGVNLPLAIVGTEVVWYNILKKLGYTKDEINQFVAGSGFLAWWQMNNLEGWGGPNPDSWYVQQAELQKKILKRMREYGIEPVLPGYAGMIPSNAKGKLNLNVTNPGLWCGFPRPAFLQPTDENFEKIADLYYTEMTKLFGIANYYAIDPFHEGGSSAGVDLDLAGKAIMKAMKKGNLNAVWVAQAWQANPRPEMIKNMRQGDLLVLDLFSENRPMWGPEWSSWYREDGFGHHDWVYCMLLNFGGRTGMYGKMQPVIDGYYSVKRHKSAKTLKGIGATMEAIENNPVMFELLYELPWRSELFSKEEWLSGYTKARYGEYNESLNTAWNILGNTVYNSPVESTQEGTTETVFAALPELDVIRVSCCSVVKPFYNTDSVKLAAEEMLSVVDEFRGNDNFEYDLVDVVRQTIANKAYYLQKEVTEAYRANNKPLFKELSNEFLTLILVQDSLLETRPEFMVGNWIEQARNIGTKASEKNLYEWNARTQVTIWGNRASAEILHNYAYKEWAGILKDVYYPRWKAFFQYLKEDMNNSKSVVPDYFAMDEKWTHQQNSYPYQAKGNPIDRATYFYNRYVK